MSALSSEPSLQPAVRRAAGLVRAESLREVAERIGVSPLEAERLRQRLAAAVERLDAGARRVWEAHAAGGSYAEIGARLGLPRDRVAAELLRARRNLRDALAPLRS